MRVAHFLDIFTSIITYGTFNNCNNWLRDVFWWLYIKTCSIFEHSWHDALERKKKLCYNNIQFMGTFCIFIALPFSISF